MSEQLGEALLVLRTDDRGLTDGINKAQPKAENLGKTLDIASGSASRLGDAMSDAGNEATGAASQMDKATGAIARLGNSQRAVTQMSGEQRVGFRQLGQQLGDMSTMFALGARPQQIFASQMDQVLQAVQLMTGGTSRLATFMGGPWGIAISTAAMVLVPLIGNLLDTDAATKKTSEASETWAQKLDLNKHSLDDVIATMREYNAEAAKANTTTLQEAEATQKAAEATLRKVLADRSALAVKLELARADAKNAENATFAPDMEGSGAAVAITGKRVSDIEASIAKNNAAIRDAQLTLHNANAGVADAQAKINSDPIAAIKERYDRLRETAKATIKDVGTLTAKLTELNNAEKAATDAEQKRQSEAKRSTGSSTAEQASIGDMTALIQQLFPGARITSTTGGKHVAGSDHYAGRAIDFVPAGGMGQYSTAEVEKMLEEAGVTIRRNANGTKQFFGPGRSANAPGDHDDHFHVAWTGGASPEEADRRAAAAKAKAEREAEQAQQVQLAADRDLAQMAKDSMNLREQMATTLQERYGIEQQALDQALTEQRRQIVENPKFTDAQKQALLAQLGIKGSLEQQLLDRRKQEDFAKQELDIAQALRANEADLLQKQLDITDIREKRKAIEQKLLDISYDKQRDALLATFNDPASSPDQMIDAADKLSNLNKAKALDQKGLNDKYQSPIQRYIHDISGVGTSLNDSMQTVAVDGLKSLDDGLMNVITRSKSLGAAFKGVANQIIADLARIALERAVIAPLGNLLFGAGTAGAGGGLFGSIFKGIGSLFSGGHAMGGLIPAGTFGIVGEHGPEPVIATSAGAMVRPNSTLSKLGGGNGGPSKLEVSVSGARGNAEIQEMVRQGVSQGLAAYDSVLLNRVRDQQARRN
ncbi:hypothetical protein [Sphingomonas oryzagri]